MFIDNGFSFATAQAVAGSGADVLSTNVFDAGSAKKLFGGAGKPFKIAGSVSAVAGTTPNFRARLVGADNAALSSNPIILADTGTSRALVAGDIPYVFELVPADQLDTKRYYGVVFTQTGNNDNTCTVSANGVIDAQSNYTGIGP